ncbi:MAG: squalene/phytoene synthase family protein [Pseudomonadota bacterium]|nr:squalene/phytoene synthase family protein [Pseudomonadota bacterium]
MTSSILSPQAFDIVAIDLHARSSFRFAMAALPPAQRRAAETVYAYCRVIDDIADSDMSADAKLRLLAAWRAALYDWRRGTLETRFAEVMVADPILATLPPDAFERLLDGMIADAAAPPTIHTLDDLCAYCGLVSVPVGELYLRILGVQGAPVAPLATALGEAVQMTNILRDVVEDAARGRCYLPAEWLGDGDSPDRMADPLTDPARFRPAFDQVHAAATARYRSARAQIAALSDADARRGVTMIHDSYYILHRLIAGLPDRGWRRRPLEKPIRLAWTLAAVGRGYLGRVLSGGA